MKEKKRKHEQNSVNAIVEPSLAECSLYSVNTIEINPTASRDIVCARARMNPKISASLARINALVHATCFDDASRFDRGWKKIEDFVGSKSVIQIRSHAQKYFLKVQKNGTITRVPPPRPKCKAAHPYPQKAPKNILMHLLGSILAPGYALRDDTPLFINTASNKIMPLRDGLAANLQGTQGLNTYGNLS